MFIQKELPTPAPIKTNSHRPSPYLRRVRLPKLDFTIAKTPATISCPFSKQKEFDKKEYKIEDNFYDKDLPEELIAKIESIQLKNEQLKEKQKRTENV